VKSALFVVVKQLQHLLPFTVQIYKVFIECPHALSDFKYAFLQVCEAAWL
jgi:hypothetical protein